MSSRFTLVELTDNDSDFIAIEAPRIVNYFTEEDRLDKIKAEAFHDARAYRLGDRRQVPAVVSKMWVQAVQYYIHKSQVYKPKRAQTSKQK